MRKFKLVCASGMPLSANELAWACAFASNTHPATFYGMTIDDLVEWITENSMAEAVSQVYSMNISPLPQSYKSTSAVVGVLWGKDNASLVCKDGV